MKLLAVLTVIIFALFSATFAEEEHDCDLPHTRNEGGFQCLAYMPRFSYNVATGECESIIYGGCGATKNNFLSKEDCEKACGKHTH